jgi:membrane-associated phospholipid phosphatase
LWYASSGFVFATATAILRIANNKHYSSDVLAGAGIGLLSGILVTNYNPFQAIKFTQKIEPRHLSILNLGKLTGWGSYKT